MGPNFCAKIRHVNEVAGAHPRLAIRQVQLVARCLLCSIGFAIREDNAEAIRPRMIMHLESAHRGR